MGKQRMKRGKDARTEKENKKARERREALWSYIFIAIIFGIILYGLYLQLQHHY